MKKTYFLFILSFYFSGILIAQQIPIFNQYLINKYSLSPAYAGYNNNFETFITYRQNWLGISGAPESKIININGPFAKNACFGASIIADKIGIFRSYSASVNYAYHLPLNETQQLSFGLAAELFENHIELSNSSTEGIIDPVVQQNQLMTGTTFNSSLGIVYTYQELNIGIVIPRLLENEIKNEVENDNVLFTLKRHFKFHSSYTYKIDKDWQIEPYFIAEKTLNNPLGFEIAALIKYFEQVWLGLCYRNSNSYGISFGATYFEKFVMNYTYEFSTEGISGASSGTHEISIGYLISKNKSTYRKPSIFKTDLSQPYYKWVK